MAADGRDRLIERGGLRQAVGHVVLAGDEPHYAPARRDGAQLGVAQVVAQAAESVRRVRGHDGYLALRVERVEPGKRFTQRALAHMSHVDQDVLLHQRVDRRLPQVRQAQGWLREQQPVEPVRQERQRRSIGRHVAPEQVRERHIRDAQVREAAHVGTHALGRVAQVKPPFHGVNQRDLVLDCRGLELGGVLDHHRIGAESRGDVALHPRDLGLQVREVVPQGRSAVRLVEIDLVERLIQDRQDHANVARLQIGHCDGRLTRRGVVGHAVRERQDERANAIAPAGAVVVGHPGERARGGEMHRVVRVEINDHRVSSWRSRTTRSPSGPPPLGPSLVWTPTTSDRCWRHSSSTRKSGSPCDS